jgi:hypothetical protein
VAARHDEFRWNPVTRQVAGSPGVVHPDGEILVDLEVEVRGVHAMVVTDSADLLPPPDLLSFACTDPVEMGVKRVDKAKLPPLDPGMADDDHVAPRGMDVTGQHDNSVADRVDRPAEASGTAAVGYKPILPKV